MDATDVAVIGAGVAGLTCARALEESGVSVRVL
ncbi:MAG: binding domain, partial [Marmoricola sp.]|nr:binding domain [Marmoricola sp.]MCW2837194.1 binding domain [Marmoricola sp.]